MKLTSSLRFFCIVMGALALSSAGLFAADASKTQNERGIIKSEHRFLWNDQTKFTEHGKTTTTAALKAGEHVRITYSGSGDLLTMQHVQIAPAKAGKPAGEKS